MLYVYVQRKTVVSNIKNNIAYTVGVITKYRASTGNNVEVIHLTFTVDEKIINTSPVSMFPKKVGKYENKSYMVAYNSETPNDCIVLFDYPITRSNSYEKYIQEFKTNPPVLK